MEVKLKKKMKIKKKIKRQREIIKCNCSIKIAQKREEKLVEKSSRPMNT
jgi:hypothetical protein